MFVRKEDSSVSLYFLQSEIRVGGGGVGPTLHTGTYQHRDQLTWSMECANN